MADCAKPGIVNALGGHSNGGGAMKRLTLIFLLCLVGVSSAQPWRWRNKVRWIDLTEAVKDSIQVKADTTSATDSTAVKNLISDSLDVIRAQQLTFSASAHVWNKTVAKDSVLFNSAGNDTVYFDVPYPLIGTNVTLDSVWIWVNSDGTTTLDSLRIIANSYGAESVVAAVTTKTPGSGDSIVKYNLGSATTNLAINMWVKMNVSTAISFYMFRFYVKL